VVGEDGEAWGLLFKRTNPQLPDPVMRATALRASLTEIKHASSPLRSTADDPMGPDALFLGLQLDFTHGSERATEARKAQVQYDFSICIWAEPLAHTS